MKSDNRRPEDVMRLEYAGKSDIGRIREKNEDAFCTFQKKDAGLFAIADGMGGYENGEKASCGVIAELSDWWEQFSPVLYDYDFRKMLSSIEQTLEYVNRLIYTKWNQGAICGATVTVLFIYKEQYGVIYAGDSRCYLGQGKKWKQVTVDEIWENQPGIGRAGKSKTHPNSGKLTNAVGVRETVRFRMVTDVIVPEMFFLLCTDGLYKFCADGMIRNGARKGRDRAEIERAAEGLIDEAYRNGAGDNITVIIIKCYSS